MYIQITAQARFSASRNNLLQIFKGSLKKWPYVGRAILSSLLPVQKQYKIINHLLGTLVKWNRNLEVFF